MTKTEKYGGLSILTAFIGISICFIIEQRFYHVISVYGTLDSTRIVFFVTMTMLTMFLFLFLRSFKTTGVTRVLSNFVAISPLGIALFPLNGDMNFLTIHWMFGILLFFGLPLNLILLYKNLKIARINIAGVVYALYIVLYLILFYTGQYLLAQFIGAAYSAILILRILIPNPIKYYGILQTDKTDAP